MATRHRLSPHFVVEEFDCHDGSKVRSEDHRSLTTLCALFLEPMRDRYGMVTILSGYRTPSHNRKVGGVSNSFHVYTLREGQVAADIRCAKGNPTQWASTLRWLRTHNRGGRGGIGVYGSFCHIDIRGYRADWKGTG